MAEQSLKEDLIIRSIKIIDIVFITVLYFIFAISFSKWLDMKIGPFNKKDNDNKSIPRLLFEIIIHLSVIAISAYIIRNIVGYIPFPLNGLYGFEHSKVKELSGGVVSGFLLYFYQYNLRSKIEYTFKRMNL
jgi:hypothetical protein